MFPLITFIFFSTLTKPVTPYKYVKMNIYTDNVNYTMKSVTIFYDDTDLEPTAIQLSLASGMRPCIGNQLLSAYTIPLQSEQTKSTTSNKYREIESIEFIKNTLYLEYPNAVIQDNSLGRKSHCGDLIFIDTGACNEAPITVMIEAKNYSSKYIPREEYEKFIADFNANDFDAAMFVSCGPATVSHSISWHKGHKPVICISDVYQNASALVMNMSFILRVSAFNRKRLDFIESFSVTQFITDQYDLLMGISDSIQNEIGSLRRIITNKEIQLRKLTQEIKGIDTIMFDQNTLESKITRVIGILNAYRKANGVYPSKLEDLYALHPNIRSIIQRGKIKKQDLYARADIEYDTNDVHRGSIIVETTETPPAARVPCNTEQDDDIRIIETDMVNMAMTRQAYMKVDTQANLVDTLGHKKASQILDAVSVPHRVQPNSTDIVYTVDVPSNAKFKYKHAVIKPDFEEKYAKLLLTSEGQVAFSSMFGNIALKYEIKRRGLHVSVKN